jgi:hypothetical protein
MTGGSLETGWEPTTPEGDTILRRSVLALADERELPAILLASDDGRPLYERMGFLPLLRFTLWLRRRTAPATVPVVD